MTRSLLLLFLLSLPTLSQARTETIETETPAASVSCSKASDEAETASSTPAPGTTAKPAGTAAPVRSATPSRSAAPRWNSLLPGMFR